MPFIVSYNLNMLIGAPSGRTLNIKSKDVIRMQKQRKGLQQNITDLIGLMDVLHHQWQEGRFEDF